MCVRESECVCVRERESVCVCVSAGRYTGSYRIPVFIFLTI